MKGGESEPSERGNIENLGGAVKSKHEVFRI